MIDEKLRKHYQDLFRKFGDAPESAQWSNRETQEKRFEVLTEIGDLTGKSILDFGCGTAQLASFLIDRKIKILNYTGVDIVEEMLACAAEKFPNYTFCNLKQALQHRYDYIFVSGVFNNKSDNNREFYQRMLKELFSICNEGLAFNMMSTYVDYYQDDLFYEQPEEVFTFVKREISPFVLLRHDYQVKPGIIPFEFSVYIYRRPLVNRT